MDYSGIKRSCIVGALTVTTLFAAYAAYLFYARSATPSDQLFDLHSFLLTAIVATWVATDSREHRRAAPSFDLGCFIFASFPLYVPYYLISTRRWRRGLLILGGIVALFLLPWFAEWFVWLLQVIVWILQPLVRLARFIVAHVS